MSSKTSSQLTENSLDSHQRDQLLESKSLPREDSLNSVNSVNSVKEERRSVALHPYRPPEPHSGQPSHLQCHPEVGKR